MRRAGPMFIGLALVGLLFLTACAGSAPETVEFNLDIRNRELEQESTVFRVKNSDTVVLLITSDEPGSLHLHGYDIEEVVSEEGVNRMEFVADIEGRFALALHPGVGGGGHSHDNESGSCREPAVLPEGADTPTIEVNAQPGPEAGEIEVGVVLQNFELSLTNTGRPVAEGHWHLYVDGELRGMYMLPDAKVSGITAGDHDIMIRLSDTEHCYLGVDAMTTVTLSEGAAGDGMSMDDGHGDHESLPEPEETVIGFLEVLPR